VLSPAASWPKTRSGWPEAPAYSPIAADGLGPGLLTAGTRSASDFNRRPSGVSLWPGYTAAASCDPGLDPASPKRSSLGGAAELWYSTTSSGSQARAARPPASACCNRTLMPCRAASLATTNKPIHLRTLISFAD
jgi:hypothetical protein